MMDLLKKFDYYDKITGMSEIGRRYFVINSFDGALTILGVLLGSYFAGLTNPSLIVTVGIGASVAIGVSGLWGAFLTEKAEREREIKELEKVLHRKLEKTDIKKAHDFATIMIALIDSLSPFFVSLFILIPFFLLLLDQTIYPTNIAYYFSFALSILVFFLLGVFLGKISKKNIILTGLKMVSAGIACIIIISLLEHG